MGHVFAGEGFTPKNLRHCVNSISLTFEPKSAEQHEQTAIFAGGCFWGVEYMFSRVPGVRSIEAGYTGGHTENPTYEEVCSHTTGHAEAVRIRFDPAQVSYETLARLFFEIHDPTQADGQGPDIGDQYRSELFYTTPEQREVGERLIGELRAKGYDVVTRITPASRFWPARPITRITTSARGSSPIATAAYGGSEAAGLPGGERETGDGGRAEKPGTGTPRLRKIEQQRRRQTGISERRDAATPERRGTGMCQTP